MKKELFHEYMTWLFTILFEFEKKADMSEYTVEGYRTPGHLAERLLTVFCWYTEKKKNLKVKRLQTIVFLKTDQKMTLAQAKKQRQLLLKTMWQLQSRPMTILFHIALHF